MINEYDYWLLIVWDLILTIKKIKLSESKKLVCSLRNVSELWFHSYGEDVLLSFVYDYRFM